MSDSTPPPQSRPSDPYGQPGPYGQQPPPYGQQPPPYGQQPPPYGQQPPPYGQPGPYGQQPPPYGHPYPYIPPEQRPRNGLGIAALVLGLVGICFVWHVFIGVVTGVVGLVLGIIAVVRVRRGDATNGGMAWSGTVLSGVAIVLSMVLFLLLMNVFVERVSNLLPAFESNSPAESEVPGDDEGVESDGDDSKGADLTDDP